MIKQIPKKIIIIGGGMSLKEGIDKDLWLKLKGKWTIGTNFSYRYFNSTFLTFVDRDFYKEESNKMTNIPLIIGKSHKIDTLSNTLMLRTHHKYTRDLSGGVYKASLVGLIALSLAIYLLDEGEIYILGFDFGAKTRPAIITHNNNSAGLIIKDDKGRAITHFYQGEIEHRGVGKINYYNSKDKADIDFGVYKDEKKVKIYNVSLKSKITIFPQISYKEFFSRLDNNNYCQDYIRAYIKAKLVDIV